MEILTIEKEYKIKKIPFTDFKKSKTLFLQKFTDLNNLQFFSFSLYILLRSKIHQNHHSDVKKKNFINQCKSV